MNIPEFIAFKKIPRLNRDICITEKIDGTNAQIFIRELGNNEVIPSETPIVASYGSRLIYAGSRNRWITPDQDNFGFATWVRENAEELYKLGPGRYFGEWWGSGIQRRYDTKIKGYPSPGFSADYRKTQAINYPSIDWVICGGESGANARPMHPAWVRSLRDQCQAAGVPFFFEKWGEWGPDCIPPVHDSYRWPIESGEPRGGMYSYRVGKKNAGHLLDGREWSELPKEAL